MAHFLSMNYSRGSVSKYPWAVKIEPGKEPVIQRTFSDNYRHLLYHQIRLDAKQFCQTLLQTDKGDEADGLQHVALPDIFQIPRETSHSPWKKIRQKLTGPTLSFCILLYSGDMDAVGCPCNISIPCSSRLRYSARFTLISASITARF